MDNRAQTKRYQIYILLKVKLALRRFAARASKSAMKATLTVEAKLLAEDRYASTNLGILGRQFIPKISSNRLSSMGVLMGIDSALKSCITLCFSLYNIKMIRFMDSQESQRLKP